MTSDYFADIEPVTFRGPDTDVELAYRYYDKDRVVLGKPFFQIGGPGTDQPDFGLSKRHGGK